jgi:hypothetical protein
MLMPPEFGSESGESSSKSVHGATASVGVMMLLGTRRERSSGKNILFVVKLYILLLVVGCFFCWAGNWFWW